MTVSDPLQESVQHVQELVLARFPETRFRLEPGGHEGIYHLSVYTPEGTLQLPLEVTEFLNQVWREHKITLITTVYSLAHYPGPHPDPLPEGEGSSVGGPLPEGEGR